MFPPHPSDRVDDPISRQAAVILLSLCVFVLGLVGGWILRAAVMR